MSSRRKGRRKGHPDLHYVCLPLSSPHVPPTTVTNDICLSGPVPPTVRGVDVGDPSLHRGSNVFRSHHNHDPLTQDIKTLRYQPVGQNPGETPRTLITLDTLNGQRSVLDSYGARTSSYV